MSRSMLIVAVAICVVAGLLFAGQARSAEPGFFASVGLGNAQSERSLNSFEKFDGDDFAWELGFGYNFGRRFAVQAAYHGLGAVAAIAGCPPELLCIATPGTDLVAFSPDEVSLDGVSLQLVGTMPLAELPIELFGKVGAMRWESDWRQNSHLDESDTDLMYGLGVNWKAADRWSLQFAYQAVELDLRSFSVGTSFRF